MILIFGGSYNGKVKFAKEKFELMGKDIFYCRNEDIDYNAKIICDLHIFVKKCVEKNIISTEIIKENIGKLRDKIIICDEINSGIVPIKEIDRKYREECGLLLQYLSNEANEVYRVFFGLGQKLK